MIETNLTAKLDRKVLSYEDFHCFLQLAAENFLLAEQFQISASSPASILPACANTKLISLTIFVPAVSNDDDLIKGPFAYCHTQSRPPSPICPFALNIFTH